MLKKQISLIFCLFINLFLILNAQSEADFLINQTFSSNIGFTCEETIEPDDCAGSQIHLVLKFTKETVLILEKEISSCDEEHISSQLEYKWTVTKDSEIEIDTDSKAIEYHFLKDLVLKIENKTIVGYKENGTKKTDRFQFKKQI